MANKQTEFNEYKLANQNTPNFFSSSFFALRTITLFRCGDNSGFGRDPDKNKHEVHGRVPKLTLYGDYDVNGRVLILPIQGIGKATLVFENVDIVVKFKPKFIEKKGKQYLQTSDSFKLDFEMGNMQLQLTNLFNGDKALGDNMNLFLNENWRDILKELKPAISYAIEEVLKSIINRIFNKVPYYEMFLDDNE